MASKVRQSLVWHAELIPVRFHFHSKVRCNSYRSLYRTLEQKERLHESIILVLQMHRQVTITFCIPFI